MSVAKILEQVKALSPQERKELAKKIIDMIDAAVPALQLPVELDKRLLEAKIISVCGDQNGFINQLNTTMVFDQNAYREFYTLFNSYREMIEGDEYIDRHIARFVVDVVTVLEGTIHQLSQRNHDNREIVDAHAEMLDLMYKLLP